MGLTGSKDEAKSGNKEKMSKEDSPERYVPYSVDRNADTYDTEALSIMDINDIIGVQTEPVGDSTLEGEMAALSAMITDDKGLTAENSPPKTSVAGEGDASHLKDGNRDQKKGGKPSEGNKN